MDFTRGTRPDARGQTRPPAYDDYQPSVEWSQDAENHLLRVYLPDFKREELKVQIDNSGRVMVKGMRQMGDRRYMRLDKAFEVPKDTIVERISGRFEEGCLFLTLPKKIKGEAPAPSQEKRDELSQREKPKSAEVEKKKEEEPTKREKPKSAEVEKKKEEEPTKKEKPKRSEDGVEREEKPKSSEDGKKKEEEATQKDKPEKEEEATKKGMPKGSEDEMKKEEKSTEVEKPKSGEDEKRKEEETTHKDKPRSSEEEMKEEEPIYTHKPKNGEEKKEREATQRERREKGEEKKKEESWYKSITGNDFNVEKARKKAAAWKKSRKDEDGWLSYGLVDDLLEKINRKRCVIAVAIVAFSVGFYVSRKLKSSGK